MQSSRSLSQRTALGKPYRVCLAEQPRNPPRADETTVSAERRPVKGRVVPPQRSLTKHEKGQKPTNSGFLKHCGHNHTGAAYQLTACFTRFLPFFFARTRLLLGKSQAVWLGGLWGVLPIPPSTVQASTEYRQPLRPATRAQELLLNEGLPEQPLPRGISRATLKPCHSDTGLHQAESLGEAIEHAGPWPAQADTHLSGHHESSAMEAQAIQCWLCLSGPRWHLETAPTPPAQPHGPQWCQAVCPGRKTKRQEEEVSTGRGLSPAQKLGGERKSLGVWGGQPGPPEGGRRTRASWSPPPSRGRLSTPTHSHPQIQVTL